MEDWKRPADDVKAGDAKRQKVLSQRSIITPDASCIPSDADVDIIKRARKDKTEKRIFDEEKESDNKAAAIPLNEETPFEPFSMASDMKFGRFDDFGHFIFRKKGAKGGDSDTDDSIDDPWLQSLNADTETAEAVSRRAQVHLQHEASAAREDPDERALSQRDTESLLIELASYLNPPNETPSGALRRLKDQAVAEKAPSTKSVNFVEQPTKDDEELNREASRLRARLQRGRAKVPNAKMTAEDQRIFDRITTLTDLLMMGKSIHGLLSMTRQQILVRAGQRDKKEVGSRSVDDLLWQFRWQRKKDQEVHGPYTSQDMHTWISNGYISKENPVEVREALPTGEPVDGLWRGWDSINFGTCTDTNSDSDEGDKSEAEFRFPVKTQRKEADSEESDEEECCL